MLDEHTLVNDADNIAACHVRADADVLARLEFPRLIAAERVDVYAFWNVDRVGEVGNVLERALK